MVFYLVVENKKIYINVENSLYVFCRLKQIKNKDDMLISEMRKVYEKNRNAL